MFLASLEVYSVRSIGKIFGERLAQFHLEFYAVVETDDVVARVYYFGADLEQRTYFVETVFFQTTTQLQLVVFMLLEIVVVLFLALKMKGNTFYRIRVIFESHQRHSPETARTQLLAGFVFLS